MTPDEILALPCPYPGIIQFREGWECCREQIAAIVREEAEAEPPGVWQMPEPKNHLITD